MYVSESWRTKLLTVLLDRLCHLGSAVPVLLWIPSRGALSANRIKWETVQEIWLTRKVPLAESINLTQTPTRNADTATSLELYSQLLMSMKDMSTQMSVYDKRLTELTHRIGSNHVHVQAEKQDMTPIQKKDAEPMFSASATLTTEGGEGARPKKGGGTL